MHLDDNSIDSSNSNSTNANTSNINNSNHDHCESSNDVNCDCDNKKVGAKKATVTVFKVGGKTTLGAGIGVLTGIFGAIAAASVFEVVVPALLITKVAGVVGGAAGLIKGVCDAEK
ncbi:MAG: hypothetical protein HQK51_08135 [Oligoflexia bacterium]|nr:hypothetical protein [Oligoflexia bacterium]